jgi:hypothetical protein
MFTAAPTRFVVISMDETRLAAMRDRWSPEFPDMTVSPGVDGERLPRVPNLTNAALGCRQAHLRVLEDFLSSDDESMLVLEDDADIPPTLRDVLMQCAPLNWDVVQFDSLLRPGWCKAVAFAPRTHAYAVSRSGAARLYLAAFQRLADIALTWGAVYPVLRTWCPETRIKQTTDETA